MPNVTVTGAREARAAFARLDPVIRARINDATENAAVHLLSNARRRVAPHRRYGFLERYLAYTMDEKAGRAKVGLPKRAAVIPAGASPSDRRTQIIRRYSGKKEITTFDVYGTGSAKGAEVIYPSKYGHLVEFGHARGKGHASAPAYPFMIPSAEEERPRYHRQCMEAGPKIERDLSVGRSPSFVSSPSVPVPSGLGPTRGSGLL